MFENIMRGITHALCEYGMWSAGLFSAHGMYEEKIPSELVTTDEEEE